MSARLDMMALAVEAPVALLRRAARLVDVFGPSWAAAFGVLADRMERLDHENRDLRRRLAEAEAHIAQTGGRWSAWEDRG